MGKGPSCTEEERNIILNLKDSGKTVNEISKLLGCSRGKVYNALKHFNIFGVTNNVPRAPRPRKTSTREDHIIVKASKADPFKSSKQLKVELESSYGINISSRTIRRRLNEASLRGCIAQRKPFVSKKNLKSRLEFAKENVNKPMSFWKNILWSDESKFCRWGSDGKRYVWRPVNQQHNPRYTIKTIKHGGGNIMVWGAFSWHGIGPIVRISSRMDQYLYKDIIENTMIPYAEDNLPLIWHFMHDNDPKHTSRLVKSCLEEKNIKVLKWPAQSPDLNPIENLWSEVEKRMEGKNPKNAEELWQNIEMCWKAIPQSFCSHLVESLPNRCANVIKNKGYPTKY